MQHTTLRRLLLRRVVHLLVGSLAAGSVALAAAAQIPPIAPTTAPAARPATTVTVSAAAPATYQVDILMKGLRRHGVVRGGLYHDPDRWPDKDGSMAICAVPVPTRAREAVCTFTIAARPGLYAAAFFQDEDDDRVFDTGFLGIPTEGYAFSRDAHAALSAPSFESAAFRVPVRTPIVATIRY